MSEPLDCILQGDALETLRTLPDGYVNCIVTSPPYFALRDYGVDGQMGLEKTPAAYIENMTALFNEVRRVLRDDGVCWVNMGDAYSSQGGPEPMQSINLLDGASNTMNSGKSRAPVGLPAKNLLGMPWRLAFALQDDGWILRSDCIWAKPNPMPESVTDRPTKSHEYVFLFSKAPRYWYDADAVREEYQPTTLSRNSYERLPLKGKHPSAFKYGALRDGTPAGIRPNPAGRNLRTVWSIPTEATSEAHFATYPQKLVERCILAGCPDRVCAECGKPWVRDVDKIFIPQQTVSLERGMRNAPGLKPMAKENRWVNYPRGTTQSNNLGFSPVCSCGASTRPGIVLDPFMGSGTTALVARRLGRHYVGIELNPSYVSMANRRLAQSDPMQDRENKEGFVQRSLFDNV